jgi:hypothetical protein
MDAIFLVFSTMHYGFAGNRENKKKFKGKTRKTGVFFLDKIAP